MAILGFSHIVSEVRSLEESLKRYRDNGFDLRFSLDMAVPQCKRPVLNQDATRTKLAYLVYQNDEACNLELIEHDTHAKTDCLAEEKIRLMLFSQKVQTEKVFEDLDGNVIRIRPLKDSGILKKKHFFLSVKDMAASMRFYQNVFDMCCADEYRMPETGANNCVLTFPKCLHPNWDGCLHLMEDRTLNTSKKYLNELGFHSFCFLLSRRQDIVDKVGEKNIYGPIQEQKQIGNKCITFEVGFVRDPDGYPVEYLLLP